MNGPYFKELPKFQNPEDELKFLREHVARREQELVEKNVAKPHAEVVSEAVKAYSMVPAAEVLHPSAKIPDKEYEAIVLRLQPEPHDNKMEELLGVILTHGIKNALNIMEKLNSPHLEDDFHRFLVQYVISVGKVPGLKEGGDLTKAIKMRLFEITLPGAASEEGKEKGFKEMIAAMEQFYAGMQSVADGRENLMKNYYTVEIALSHTSDEVVFYMAVPISKGDLLEKQILGNFPDAKVKEVPDDYNIFNPAGVAVGSVGQLSEHPALPLKTYDTFEYDPMNSLLNVFSKLKREGEGAAVQFTIVPAGEEFTQKFVLTLREIKEGEKLRRTSPLIGELGKFGRTTKEVVFDIDKNKDKDKEKKVDDRKIELIGAKLKSTIVNTHIRILASADTQERAKSILHDLESAFNQFTEPEGNNLRFKCPDGKELKELFHYFSFRLLQNEGIFSRSQLFPLNFKELTTICHFPAGIKSSPQLKEAKSGSAPAPMETSAEGILLGINSYRGRDTQIRMAREDRMRHFYVIGQTGTGKTVALKNMIVQDIKNGDGCCFIDPHGSDVQDILAQIPKERVDDVIYFDPAYIPRPMGLNMLEFDPQYPEQKTFIINELVGIFNKLFDMKTSGGPMFEQYFRNSAMLTMEHPESGNTLLEIGRILGDKEFRDMKLSHCKNPIVAEFWRNAEKTTGEQSLSNFVPYVTSKFDVFISNEIMRPVVLQEKSSFNFRKIMDEKKILLVNLSKGRLGDINSNLVGLILVGKIQMAALSRVDMFGQKMNDFYLYIDEFQNVTTDSISSILSEARKYRLSLNIAHQYIKQLEESIKNAVFGNVGSMAIFRVSPEDAEALEPRFKPIFTKQDIIKLDNYNAYMSMLINGQPAKPFNIRTLSPEVGQPEIAEKIKELSYLKYGRPREEVEAEIIAKYEKRAE